MVFLDVIYIIITYSGRIFDFQLCGGLRRPNFDLALFYPSFTLYKALRQVKLLITLLCLKLQGRVSTHFKALLILYTTVTPSDQWIIAKISKDHRKVDQKTQRPRKIHAYFHNFSLPWPFGSFEHSFKSSINSLHDCGTL